MHHPLVERDRLVVEGYLLWWKGVVLWWRGTFFGGGAMSSGGGRLHLVEGDRLVVERYLLWWRMVIWWFVGTRWCSLNISSIAFILAFKSSNFYSYIHLVSTLYWSYLSWSDLRPPCGFEKNSLISTSWPLALIWPEYFGVPKAWKMMSLVLISINSPLSHCLQSASYKNVLKINVKYANK